MDGSPSKNPAPGGPGIEPRWTRGAKEGVGTAFSAASRVWFTISQGVVTEVYWPTINRPQIRDLQLLVTDEETFFHEERRNLETEIHPIGEHALGFRIIKSDPAGRYENHKEIVTDPGQSSLLIDVRIEVAHEWRNRLRVFILCAPHLDHLEVGGWHNNGEVDVVCGRSSAGKQG